MGVTVGLHRPLWWGHTFLSQSPCSHPSPSCRACNLGAGGWVVVQRGWCRHPGRAGQTAAGPAGDAGDRDPGAAAVFCVFSPFFFPPEKRKIINSSEVVAIPRLALAPMAWLVSGHLAPEAEGRPGGSPRSPQWSLGLEVTRRRDWWLSLTQPVGAREGWAELRELREPWGGKTGQSAISRAGPSASESPKCKRDNIPAAEGSWPLARRGF